MDVDSDIEQKATEQLALIEKAKLVYAAYNSPVRRLWRHLKQSIGLNDELDVYNRHLLQIIENPGREVLLFQIKHAASFAQACVHVWPLITDEQFLHMLPKTRECPILALKQTRTWIEATKLYLQQPGLHVWLKREHQWVVGLSAGPEKIISKIVCKDTYVRESKPGSYVPVTRTPEIVLNETNCAENLISRFGSVSPQDLYQALIKPTRLLLASHTGSKTDNYVGQGLLKGGFEAFHSVSKPTTAPSDTSDPAKQLAVIINSLSKAK